MMISFKDAPAISFRLLIQEDENDAVRLTAYSAANTSAAACAITPTPQPQPVEPTPTPHIAPCQC